MSYQIERLPDVPAVVATFNADFDAATELESVITELRQTISNEAHPIYVVMDLSAYNISMNDLFVGTGVGMRSRDTEKKAESMDKTLKTIIVTKHKILQASIKGFERFGFGKDLELATSLDDALQIIRNAA